MSMKEQLIECLQDIESDITADVTSDCFAKAAKTLNIAFELCRRSDCFSASEKKTIDSLLPLALHPLRINVERTVCRYRTRLETSVRQKRSALQFLIENSESIYLKQELKKIAVALDVIIQKWQDTSDSDEGESDLESAGASKMPPTHTWWPR